MALTKSCAEIIADDTTGLLTIHPSWQRVRLDEVARVLNGFAFDSGFFNATQGAPLVRIRDILTGTTETRFSGDYDEQFMVQAGELLIGMDGDFHCARWKGAPALLNQRVCKITPNESLYSGRLLAYLLPGYLEAVNAATSSITVKHLSSRTVEGLELPLPPLAEQGRIAETLEAMLSDLDAGTAELHAARRKLIVYRQSVLKAAVEGSLTAGWRDEVCAGESTEPETGEQLLKRILFERRAQWEVTQLARFKQQGKVAPAGWESRYPLPGQGVPIELRTLPNGWVWASVDQLSPDDLSNGRSVPSADGGAKVLRLTAVKGGKIDLSEAKEGDWTVAEAAQFVVTEGDLLIVRGNGSLPLVGRAGLVSKVTAPVAYPDTLIRLRVLNAFVRPAWVGLCWDSQAVRTHFEGRARTSAGIYKISQPDIRSVCIPVPPLAEQDEILRLFDACMDGLATTQAALAAAGRVAAAQRRNLLKCAFSGQLVPQDPADEPAPALLARIQAARAAQATAQAPKSRPRPPASRTRTSAC